MNDFADRHADTLGMHTPFLTTRWSVVLRAGKEESEEALAQLCRDYWYPLYAFARKRGLAAHDAQDATQGFFLHLLEGGMLRRAASERGKFRTFLLGAMQHFLANERRAQQRLKRGGGEVLIELDALDAEGRFALEPADAAAEVQFDRSWGFALIELVFRRLAEEFSLAGRAEMFKKIRPFLTAESSRPGYDAVARELGTSVGAVRVTIHRMRQRYGELLREEILHTVSSPEELDAEIAYLMEVVARG